MEREKNSKFKKFIKRKRVIIPLALIVLIGGNYLFFHKSSAIKNTTTDFARYVDLRETIPVTGQVISKTDLNLSFNNSGVVKSIKVKVGDQVKANDILATLNQGEALASLTQARGVLAGAKAKYKKILEGASNEEIALARISLNNAERDYENVKIQQETLVKNAHNNLLNSTPEAIPGSGTSDFIAPTISGNYNLGKEGKIIINIYYTGNGARFSATGIVTGDGAVTTITPQPIGDSGLSIKFGDTTNSSITNWVIEIPNKKATNYLTNYNAYQLALKTQSSALSSAQSLIDQRMAELAIKESSARDSEIELAQADILSAEGQVQAAEARYENTIIRAPTDGTITEIGIKVGELAQAQKEVMVLQDVTNMYLEANVNEANIDKIKIGALTEVTFDAFGSEKTYQTTIAKIDPSATLISGVVNYKITASLDQIVGLKPEMSANLTVIVAEKHQVIAVPARAILTDSDGQRTIRLITNSQKKKFKTMPVVTGLDGDGGLTEIISGLTEGQEYVVLIRN